MFNVILAAAISASSTNYEIQLSEIESNGHTICQAEIAKNGNKIYSGECEKTSLEICQDRNFINAMRGLLGVPTVVEGPPPFNIPQIVEQKNPLSERVCPN